MGNSSWLMRAAMRKAAEAVERAGGTEAVMMEVMGAVARFNQQRRVEPDYTRQRKSMDREDLGGSIETDMSELFAATDRDLTRDEKVLRQQGFSDASIATIMFQRREAAASEMANLISAYEKSRHETAMNIIRNF